MNEVFILGSGFSKAIDTRMPTLPELSTKVVEAMGDAWLPEWGDDLRQNVELLLTYLGGQNPWERSGEHYYQRGMFHDVQDAVVAMLRDVQAEVLRETDSPPHWLDRLVRYWHTQQATVVTFNYDVLPEKAFSEIRDGDGTGGRRHPSELFCVPLADASTRSGRGGKYGLGDRGKTFSLLKLHGSLAWFYSGPGAPPGDTVYSTDHWGWHPPPPGDLRNVADKEPLMVPPLLQKSPYYANDVLREQWRQLDAP